MTVVNLYIIIPLVLPFVIFLKIVQRTVSIIFKHIQNCTACMLLYLTKATNLKFETGLFQAKNILYKQAIKLTVL